jgi:hypothetical protein
MELIRTVTGRPGNLEKYMLSKVWKLQRVSTPNKPLYSMRNLVRYSTIVQSTTIPAEAIR